MRSHCAIQIGAVQCSEIAEESMRAVRLLCIAVLDVAELITETMLRWAGRRRTWLCNPARCALADADAGADADVSFNVDVVGERC